VMRRRIHLRYLYAIIPSLTLGTKSYFQGEYKSVMDEVQFKGDRQVIISNLVLLCTY